LAQQNSKSEVADYISYLAFAAAAKPDRKPPTVMNRSSDRHSSTIKITNKISFCFTFLWNGFSRYFSCYFSFI